MQLLQGRRSQRERVEAKLASAPKRPCFSHCRLLQQNLHEPAAPMRTANVE
jgi:hypothetical protein